MKAVLRVCGIYWVSSRIFTVPRLNASDLRRHRLLRPKCNYDSIDNCFNLNLRLFQLLHCKASVNTTEACNQTKRSPK